MMTVFTRVDEIFWREQDYCIGISVRWRFW